MPYPIAIALGLGLMVSPDTLGALGHAVAGWGWWAPIGVAAAAALFVAVAAPMAADGTDTTAVQRVLSAGPVLVTIFGGAGLLVSAGFAFNETLLYWFPNFGFAYLLLAVLTVLHWVGPVAVGRVQWLLVGIVGAGMLVMVIARLMAIGTPPAPSVATAAPFSAIHWPVPVLAFIGFDMALGAARSRDRADALRWTIIIGAVLFAVWTLVSVSSVSADRLAATTVPHWAVARAVMGAWASPVIGAITIAGTAAAVNALLAAVPRWLPVSGPPSTAWPSTVAAIAMAAVMAMGFAGEPELNLWIQSGLCLWLARYAVAGWHAAGGLSWIQGTAAAGLGMVTVMAVIVHPATTAMIGRMAIAVLIAGSALIYASTRRKYKTAFIDAHPKQRRSP